MAQAGSLYTSLTLESASFISGLKKAAEQTGESASKIEQKLSSIINVGKGLAAVAGGTALFQAGKAALDYASSLAEVAQQLGVTSNDLQIYRYAATQVGISQEGMDAGLQKFTRSLGDARSGGKQTAAVFRSLGFTDEEIKHLDAHDALLKTADGIAKITDRTSRATPEVALFGKAGQQLDNLLSGGSAAIGQLADEARRLGLVLTPEQIAKADNAADAFARVKLQLEVSIASTVSDNAAAIEKFADALGEMVAIIPNAISQLDRFQQYVARAQANAEILVGIATQRPEQVAHGVKAKADANYQLGTYLNTSRDADPAGRAGDLLSGIAFNAARGSAASGGEGYTAPNPGASAAAANKAAREAEQARKKALAQDDAYHSALERDYSEYLGLREQLTADLEEQADLERGQVIAAAASRKKALQRDVAEGHLLGFQADEIEAQSEITDKTKLEVIARDFRLRQAEQTFASAQADLDNQRDLLAAQEDLASSSGDRRDIALQLLALDERSLRAAQERIIGDESASQAAKDDAALRLKAIDALHPYRVAKAANDNQSPGAAYLRTLSRTPGEIADGFETSGVSALEKFNASLDDSVKSALHLHGIFGDIIGDLIDMAIKQAVIKPIADALFGGSGSSGGLLGTLFSAAKGAAGSSSADSFLASSLSGFHFAKGGRPPTGLASLVGEDGPELFIPDVAGTITSNKMLGGGALSLSMPINIDATGADAAGLARVQIQLDQLRRDLPGQIVSTVNDARERRAIRG